MEKNNEKEITITIEGKEWKDAIDKAFEEANKKVKIDGFRPGKAPKDVFYKKYGKESLFLDAADIVLNDAYKKMIDENKDLKIVAQPQVALRSISEEKVEFNFTLTTYPEVKLGKYKKLGVEKESVEVTEEEIKNAIDEMRNRYAENITKDGAIEEGNIAIIDFDGYKDGVAFEGGKAENYSLEVGSHTFIPGFEEQLVGVKKGEEKDVEVTFPENYQAAELAGQPATFHCTVHEVKYKDLPELNDELIKKLKIENVETVDAYKEKVKTDLTAQKEREAEENFTNELLGKVCDNANVEIPAVMIDAEVDRMYKEFEGRMQQSGFTAKQFLEATHQTEEAIRAQMSPEAAARVKTQLVLEAIVKAESIEASDEDVEKAKNILGI